MRAAVPIEHDGVRGLVAVGIIVEAIDHPVGDQLPMLIVAAVIALLLAFALRRADVGAGSESKRVTVPGGAGTGHEVDQAG
jgi:hypothetical protein